eukprot:CAMPEP_0185376078 /NCGR_PEP_ID=MMETSP1364-20130426/38222_1 /TAXON_ID=38817 /ORGANISM="Gephyrocapsa oceanica, Strain RCC1303" /LENGTH=43 /DNA_ID= /DNA_START= /DNA_END= /DNA_ORIENTATION=
MAKAGASRGLCCVCKSVSYLCLMAACASLGSFVTRLCGRSVAE